MQTRFVMEIVGSVTAFCTDAQGPTSSLWANTYLPVIAEIPSGTVLSEGKLNSEIDYGGFTVKLTDVSGVMNDLGIGNLNKTKLTANLNRVQTTITVTSTAGFASTNGILKIGSEFVFYSGTTGTTFTGCVRGIRGSFPSVHLSGKDVVENYNYLVGRDVHCYWENKQTGSKWTRFVGQIDSVYWDRGYYHLTLVSRTSALREQEALTRPYLRGAAYPMISSSRFTSSSVIAAAQLGVNFYNVPRDFAESYIDSTQNRFALKGEKVNVRTGGVVTSTLPSIPATFLPNFLMEYTGATNQLPTNIPFPLDASIVDSFATVYTGAITSNTPSLGQKIISIQSNQTLPTSGAATVTLSNFVAFGVSVNEFAEPEEVAEVRILEGNLVTDILLPLFVSTGTGQNSSYDVLPVGWGLGLPAKVSGFAGIVDIASFERFALRAGFRRYVFEDSVNVFELAAEGLVVSGCFLYIAEDGIIELRALEEIQPNTPVSLQVTNSVLASGETPRIDFGASELFTSANYQSSGGAWHNPTKENVSVTFDLEATLYGQRSRKFSDTGIIEGVLPPSTIYGFLLNYARPYGRLKVKMPSTFGTKLEVGQIAEVNLSHLPNCFGNKGITELCLIEAISYSDSEGLVELSLLVRTPLRNTGLIAPSGLILSEDDDVVTLKSSAATLYAPTNFSLANPPHNGTGIQDSDWFAVNDEVVIFRYSTLDAATPDIHETRIAAINYATREITLVGTPAWTMVNAPIRLATPSVWSNLSQRSARVVFYICLDPSGVSGISGRFWSV